MKQQVFTVFIDSLFPRNRVGEFCADHQNKHVKNHIARLAINLIHSV